MRSSCVTFHSFDIHYQHGWEWAEQTLNLSQQNMKKIFIKTFFSPSLYEITFPNPRSFMLGGKNIWVCSLAVRRMCDMNIYSQHMLCKWFRIWSRNCLPQIILNRKSLETFVIELIPGMYLDYVDQGNKVREDCSVYRIWHLRSHSVMSVKCRLTTVQIRFVYVSDEKF